MYEEGEYVIMHKLEFEKYKKAFDINERKKEACRNYARNRYHKNNPNSQNNQQDPSVSTDTEDPKKVFEDFVKNNIVPKNENNTPENGSS